MAASRKIMLIGDGGIGKTTLIRSLMGQPFKQSYVYRPTGPNGPDYTIEYNGTTLNLFDIAGQHKYSAAYINKLMQMNEIDHVVLMYDCTSQLSYKSLDWWSDKVQKPLTVVANKVDIQLKQVKPLASHMQISCKTGEGIAELMSHIM